LPEPLPKKASDDLTESQRAILKIIQKKQPFSPRKSIVKCPGSGERLNLSSAEATRGTMCCSYCHQWFKVRVNRGTDKQWPEATMPQHKAV
jgi:transcription elongation factor Elf1